MLTQSGAPLESPSRDELDIRHGSYIALSCYSALQAYTTSVAFTTKSYDTHEASNAIKSAPYPSDPSVTTTDAASSPLPAAQSLQAGPRETDAGIDHHTLISVKSTTTGTYRSDKLVQSDPQPAQVA